MSPLRSFWLRLPVRGKGLVVVAPPTAAVVVLGVILLVAGARAATLQDATRIGRQARIAIDGVLADVLSAESGVRAYLLTRDPGFLEPFNSTRAKMPRTLEELRSLLEPFPTARVHLGRASRVIDERFAVLDRTVGFVAPGGPFVQPPPSMISEGTSITDLLRVDLGALDRVVHESVSRADERLARVQDWAAAGAIGIVAGVLGGIVAMLLFTRGVARRVATIERNARRLSGELPLERMPDGADEIAAAARALEEAATLLADRTGQLRESEQRFRSLVHDAVGIVAELDLDTRFTYVSPSVRSVLGYEPAGLTGMRAMELVHPDDLEVVSAAIERSIREPGSAYTAQVRFRHASGEWRWLSAAGRTLLGRDGGATKLIVNAQDETDRAERQLLAARLASIVESSDDAMIAVAPDGAITAWNDGAARMYGRAADEMLGRTMDVLAPPDRVLELGEVRDRAARGERFQLQTTLLAENGRPLDVWLTVAPVHDTDGATIGASIIARDISARMEAERKLVAAERRLRSILNNMGEGVVVANAGGFELFNPAADRLLGTGTLSVDPGRWHREYHVFRRDGSTPFSLEELPLGLALRGESSDGVEMLVQRNGEPDVWLRLTGRPVVDEDGVVVAGIMVFTDVSEAKRIELAREARRAELERSNRVLQDIALVDELTGVPNRRGFFHRAQGQLVAALGSGRKAVLLFVDVDGLKTVNDELGHDVGSSLLVDVAEVLTRTGRATDLVARLSGDEFCLFSVVDRFFDARVLTRRLEDALATFNAVEERPYLISLSYGAAEGTPDRPLELDALIREADHRMYEHKRGKWTARA